MAQGTDKLLHVPRIENIEENYNSFWKELLETDGVLDLQKVKNELYDWHFVMEQVGTVYCHITGHRMSNILYYAQDVISEADDYYSEIEKENIKDSLEQVQDALEYALENMSQIDGNDETLEEALTTVKLMRGEPIEK